ncbi:MAG: hypothetical protein ACE5GI_09360 [Candidatus Aminicenantales bacterium]
MNIKRFKRQDKKSKLTAKRTLTFFSMFFLFCSFILLHAESSSFLLFGLSIKPSPKNLSDSWWISQGGDFSIIALLSGGYETGLAYRVSEDKAEYQLKTFFNLKYDLFHFAESTLYLGGGAGFLELIRVTKLRSDFNFFFGYQGIVGIKIGQAKKDKLCFEIHFLESMEEGRGLQINFLAGVRF